MNGSPAPSEAPEAQGSGGLGTLPPGQAWTTSGLAAQIQGRLFPEVPPLQVAWPRPSAPSPLLRVLSVGRTARSALNPRSHLPTGHTQHPLLNNIFAPRSGLTLNTRSALIIVLENGEQRTWEERRSLSYRGGRSGSWFSGRFFLPFPHSDLIL